jgi:Pvc16 N-terminal domain
VSAFGVIKHVTDVLIAGINAAFDADSLTKPYVNTVFSDSPATPGAGTNAKKGLSFWPYRVTRDEFVSNEPLIPVGTSLLSIPPLRVDVWYLATPMTGSGDADQLLLEKTLQYVYDTEALDLGTDTARITFETPGTEELFRLWSALDIPYALSSVFCARHVSIDSLRALQRAARVIERFDRYVRTDS